MSMEFVNRICPNCKNPNYMVWLGDFSKAYKYKCMNCNGYFNDIDFEKEPLQPVWKSECMNTKVDMQEAKQYNSHEVACIIADLFGDPCACNFNDIDEWLPYKCDFGETCCPNPGGVACWEQYLKHKEGR